MFGSKDKKEAKKAAKLEAKEAKLEAKKAKKEARLEAVETAKEARLEAEEAEKIATQEAKEAQDIFRQHIEENLDKDPDELENPDFIRHSDSFWLNRSGRPANLPDYFYYRSQIDIDTLYKRATKDKPTWLDMDVDTEVPLLFYDNRGMVTKNRFLVTNKNFFYYLDGGKRGSDNAEIKGKMNLRQLKGTVAVKGYVMQEIVIDGMVLGGIDLKGGKKSTKRMLEDYLQSIALNSESWFGAGASSEVVVQQMIDPIDQIKKLKDMQDAGIITEEEFEAKKTKLMEQI